MPARPTRFATHTFLDQVQRRLFAVVRVGHRVEEFHAGVAEFFDNKYPRLFSFGLLNRRDVRAPHWWDDNFVTAVGPLRAGVKDGYHLFHTGLVVAHHPGTTRPPVAVYEDELQMAKQREQAMRHGFKGARVVPPGALEACRQIVFGLDEIVERKQTSSGFSSEGPTTGRESRESRESSRRASDDRTPVAAPSRAPNDPFALLEVSNDATDAEIKAAYRRAMKLNHPDKVAHMSTAIQEFAVQRSLLIKQAYDSIISMKRH